MTLFPETQASLIARLANPGDALAWQEFARLYQPAVFRVARRRGLQPADADELVQNTLVAVARHVERFDPDPERGRFRDWLYRIACHQAVSLLRRCKRPLAAEVNTTQWEAALQDSGGSALSREFEWEFRREAFRVASDRVRSELSEKHWQAFWKTSIDRLPVSQVAAQLRMTIGSVYIARSRIMARLRREAAEWEQSARSFEGDRS